MLVSAGHPNRPRAVGAASFVGYALGHADLRAKLAIANKAVYAGAAEELSRNVAGGELPMPAETFVQVIKLRAFGRQSFDVNRR